MLLTLAFSPVNHSVPPVLPTLPCHPLGRGAASTSARPFSSTALFRSRLPAPALHLRALCGGARLLLRCRVLCQPLLRRPYFRRDFQRSASLGRAAASTSSPCFLSTASFPLFIPSAALPCGSDSSERGAASNFAPSSSSTVFFGVDSFASDRRAALVRCAVGGI